MFPWLVRHAIYPFHELLLGRPTYRVLRELEVSQWWPGEQLEQLQDLKLRSLLLHAWDRCPGQRARLVDRGFTRSDLARFRRQDLSMLPMLDKQTIRENLNELVDHTVPGGAFRYNTGGSSGEPLIFYFDRRRQAHDQAARIRTHAWFGVRHGEREAYLWGAPVELSKQDRAKSFRDRLTNQLLLNAFDMSAESMIQYLDRIKRFRPSCLFGYPSSLSLLADFVRERPTAGSLSSLKAIFVTGEKLYPHQLQSLRDTFDVPIADCLGARDAGFLVHQCPEGSMHLTAESVIVEIVDVAGSPVSAGELGEIVVTHLENYAQPFLRYRTGDMGRLGLGACRCGRGLPLMQVAEGRSTDFLVRSDGAVVHALAVIYTLRDLPGVRSFRVHQDSAGHVNVRVVRADEYVPNNDARIVSEIRRRLGETVEVNVIAVESLPPERSGKFRYVTSDVDWRTAIHG